MPTKPPSTFPPPVSFSREATGLVRIRPGLRAGMFGLGLFVAIFVTYLPCLHGGILWDDDAWTVYLRPLFESPDGLWRIWTQATALQQYYPLTGTMFWLDHHLWGEWTLPYHLQNVAWHAIAAVLFWRVLVRLEAPAAWLAAALFGLHPVMVESVAWLAERKNVLSLALLLGAMLCYLKARPVSGEGAPPDTRRWYALALVLFLAALLAKVTAYVFAPTVLLLVWWKRGSLPRSEVRALLPFFALSVLLGSVVAWVEKHHVGAEGADWDATFAERFLHAGRALWFYLGHLLWPADLRFMYPRWSPDPGTLVDWFPSALVIVAGLALWGYRRRIDRGIFMALFFFLGSIFPVLGFLNVYGMRFASVADHWVYLPSLGFFALLSAGVARLAVMARAAWVPAAFAIVALPLLATLGWREAHQYRDHETLWLTTRAKDPAHWMPHYQLGLLAMGAGRPADALAHYQRSVAVNPEHPIAYSNIGAALAQLGRSDEAIAAYRQSLAQGSPIPETRHNLALSLLRTGDTVGAILETREAIAMDPGRAEFHRTLGTACEMRGMTAEALASYREAIRLAPSDPAAPLALGMLLLKTGQPTEALASLRLATSLAPDSAIAHANTAAALIETGAFEAAIAPAGQALALNPNLRGVHQNLGIAYFQLRRYDDALDAFLESARRNPTLAAAHAHAALILAASPVDAQRDGPRALELAQKANELSGGKDLTTLRALAAAHAELKQYPEAERLAEHAAALATSPQQASLRDLVKQEAARYRRGEPLRLPAAP